MAFSLKKSGDPSLKVRTTRSSSLRDNIASVFGSSVADELVEVEMGEDDGNKAPGLLRLRGLVSNVNYNAKKFNFLLFINHRLVRFF